MYFCGNSPHRASIILLNKGFVKDFSPCISFVTNCHIFVTFVNLPYFMQYDIMYIIYATGVKI